MAFLFALLAVAADVKFTSGETEMVWELPATPPRAVFFLAHGCAHSSSDFWPPTLSAKHALGLPEEVRLRKKVVSSGYAALAVSSSDRANSRCWSFEVDGPLVKRALASFFAATSLSTSLPVVAFGASSGGAFVLQLPQIVPTVAAVVSQIMALPPSMLPPIMPPTLFVHMPRDQRTAAYVTRCVKRLRQGGVVAHEIEVHPQRPTAEFFLQRIEGLSPASANALHAALKKGGLLNASGHLRDDPRRSSWRDVVHSTPGLGDALPGPSPNGAPDSLVGDESAVSEALNVAWAQHEIASDPTDATLRWLADLETSKAAQQGTPGTVRRASSVEASSELR